MVEKYKVKPRIATIIVTDKSAKLLEDSRQDFYRQRQASSIFENQYSAKARYKLHSSSAPTGDDIDDCEEENIWLSAGGKQGSVSKTIRRAHVRRGDHDKGHHHLGMATKRLKPLNDLEFQHEHELTMEEKIAIRSPTELHRPKGVWSRTFDAQEKKARLERQEKREKEDEFPDKTLLRQFNLFSWIDDRRDRNKPMRLVLWREGVWDRNFMCIQCEKGVKPGFGSRICLTCPVVCHEKCALTGGSAAGVPLNQFHLDALGSALSLWPIDKLPTLEKRHHITKDITADAWVCKECAETVQKFQDKFDGREQEKLVSSQLWDSALQGSSTAVVSAMIRLRLRIRKFRGFIRLITRCQARVRGWVVRRQVTEFRARTPWGWQIQVNSLLAGINEEVSYHGYKTTKVAVPQSFKVIVAIVDDQRGVGSTPEPLTGNETQLVCFSTGGGQPVTAASVPGSLPGGKADDVTNSVNSNSVDQTPAIGWGQTFDAPCTLPRTLVSLTVIQADKVLSKPRFIGQARMRLWKVLQQSSKVEVDLPLGPLLHHPVIQGLNNVPGKSSERVMLCTDAGASGGGRKLKIEITPYARSTSICSFLWSFECHSGAVRPVKRWAVLSDNCLRLYLRPLDTRAKEVFNFKLHRVTVSDSVPPPLLAQMGPSCGSPLLMLTCEGSITVLGPPSQSGSSLIAMSIFQSQPAASAKNSKPGSKLPLAPGLEEIENSVLMANWLVKLKKAALAIDDLVVPVKKVAPVLASDKRSARSVPPEQNGESRKSSSPKKVAV